MRGGWNRFFLRFSLANYRKGKALASPLAGWNTGLCLLPWRPPALCPEEQSLLEGLISGLCLVAEESLRDVSAVTLDSGPPHFPQMPLHCHRVSVWVGAHCPWCQLTPVSQVGPAPLSCWPGLCWDLGYHGQDITSGEAEMERVAQWGPWIQSSKVGAQ